MNCICKVDLCIHDKYVIGKIFLQSLIIRSCLRSPNEQKVAVSLHQFEVIHGALVAQKSDHISCKIR